MNAMKKPFKKKRKLDSVEAYAACVCPISLCGCTMTMCFQNAVPETTIRNNRQTTMLSANRQ